MSVPALFDELIAAAHGTWPTLAVDSTVFAAYLLARLPANPTPAVLRTLHGNDLYLACSVAAGDEEAQRIFETQFVHSIDQFLGRLQLDADILEEAKQLVREKLLVGDRPRILDYTGRGELRSWLCATATRTALNLLRSRRRAIKAEDDRLLDMPAVADDPETLGLRSRYAAEFRAAFGEALAQLTPHQRVLLKRHFVDQLSTDALGTIHQVHRVTVLRWLTQTRERLASLTQSLLMQRLGLATREFDSIVRVVRSQLDFSLRHILE